MRRKLLSLIPSSLRMPLRGAHERLFAWRKTSRSYSQFGEDAVLRALLDEMAHHGNPVAEPGFYVDIGAFQPVTFSNTYALYKRGWRGITIEASPGSEPLFRMARPRDIHVNVAIGDRDGSLKYYTWGTPTVVNTADADHAARFAIELGREPEVVEVPVRTLATVLDKYLPASERIDVISVDIEGMGLACLQGNDWTRYKPRIILVEFDLSPFDGEAVDPSIAFLKALGYTVRSVAGPTAILVDNP